MADKNDKTEKPTGKRLQEARREGRVAKTPELSAWLAVLVASFLVPILLGSIGAAAEHAMLSIRDAFADPTPQRMVNSFASTMTKLFVALIPVMLGFLVLTVIADVVQIGGVRLATKAARPSFRTLNPAAGIKRLVSVRSLYELAKNVAKVAIIAYIGYPLARDMILQLIATGIVPFDQVVGIVGSGSLDIVRRIAIAGLVVAVVDYAYQKRRLRKELKMTKEEVKEEAKQAEGNQEVKGKIKGKMMAASRNRMLAAVKSADVVIVNPVHIAVALAYEPSRGAPRVVALGQELLAERIKTEAEAANVPIVESIPLARALWASCDLEDEIPLELYEAVARVLAFVQRLGRRRPLGGSVHQLPPSLVQL